MKGNHTLRNGPEVFNRRVWKSNNSKVYFFSAVNYMNYMAFQFQHRRDS